MTDPHIGSGPGLLTVELAELVAPTGRVVGVDVSDDMLRASRQRADRMARIIRAWKRGFAHPHLPATLGRRLRAAGFDTQPPTSHVLLNSSYDPETFSVRHLPIMAEFVQRHGIGADEATTWARDLEHMGERGDYFFNLNGYLFVARKPA